jgi:hypothetical protein
MGPSAPVKILLVWGEEEEEGEETLAVRDYTDRIFQLLSIRFPALV